MHLHMNQRHYITHRIERANIPYHVVTVSSSWRKLPYVLDAVRDLNMDVRKAYLTPSDSTFYLKETNGQPLTLQRQQELSEAFDHGVIVDIRERYKMVFQTPFKLPKDTRVLLYNVPAQIYTVLEFTCADRIGLLCDILDALSSFPIEIEIGHISTVSGFAHNVLQLTKDGRALNDAEMEYVHNVFEYEIKQRVGDDQPSE